MSAYRDAVSVGEETTNRSPTVVIVPKEEAKDNFWTVVKWIGAAVTLIVGYREAKDLYNTYLRRQNPDGEEGAEGEATEET